MAHVLVLALAGFLPFPMLASMQVGRAPERSSVLAPAQLHLELDLTAALDPWAPIARELDGGVTIGSIRVGIDGQPSTPWLSNFLHQQEMRPAPLDLWGVDPAALASAAVVRIQIGID